MKKVLIAIEIVLIVALGTFLLFIYSGRYNIAATAGHYDVVRWALETTMENSVRHHAGGITVPPLEDRPWRSAFDHFDHMCVLCHGAPGLEPSELGKGIVPRPPDLAKAVPEWLPQELFWMVKNGIKMSGMPAFGVTHDDETIWDIIVFILQLPDLTPAEYQDLIRQHRSAPPAEQPNGLPQPHPPGPRGEKPAGGLPADQVAKAKK